MTDRFNDNKRCFVCGPGNPEGLRLEFRIDKDRGEAEANVNFPGRFQGWEKIVHGGLLATVLDEAMIYAAGAKGLKCVTGEITVRYVKPAGTNEAYRLKGWVTGKKGKITFAESEIIGGDGEVVARASGKLFKVVA
jgi:acyl-coenzyme A thioesterase PaaI-like protein